MMMMTTLTSLVLILVCFLVNPAEAACGEGESQCPDGETCVYTMYLCDAFPYDCPNNSDEDADFCKKFECDQGYSKCADGVTCAVGGDPTLCPVVNECTVQQKVKCPDGTCDWDLMFCVSSDNETDDSDNWDSFQ